MKMGIFVLQTRSTPGIKGEEKTWLSPVIKPIQQFISIGKSLLHRMISSNSLNNEKVVSLLSAVTPKNFLTIIRCMKASETSKNGYRKQFRRR
jgi:hypothetical protein